MSDANLSAANFSVANFEDANLSGANLSDSIIISNSFSEKTVLLNANFENAIIDNDSFRVHLIKNGCKNIPEEIKNLQELRLKLESKKLNQDCIQDLLMVSKFQYRDYSLYNEKTADNIRTRINLNIF